MFFLNSQKTTRKLQNVSVWEGIDAIAVVLAALAILGYSFVVLILYRPAMATTQENASFVQMNQKHQSTTQESKSISVTTTTTTEVNV